MSPRGCGPMFERVPPLVGGVLEEGALCAWSGPQVAGGACCFALGRQQTGREAQDRLFQTAGGCL